MKNIITVIIALSLISCQKKLTRPDTVINNRHNQALSFTDNKKIYVYQDITVPYSTVLFDSCANENIIITGTERDYIKTSFTAGPDFYYLYYEIDLDCIGIGEISKLQYHGKGKIIGSISAHQNSEIGKYEYKLKYTSTNSHQITIRENGLFVATNGNIRIDRLDPSIEECK